MTFPNRKKTYLAKLDKSKKGELDKRVIPLLNLINFQKDYFTTSSCSGRVVLWQGSGKKNETRWLKVSHDLIEEDFFHDLSKEKDLVWLRLEPFIMHVCCQNLESASRLLFNAKKFFKKSSLLSFRNKIIVEIKGSEFLEFPLLKDRQFLLKKENLPFLTRLVNKKLHQVHRKIDLFYQSLENLQE